MSQTPLHINDAADLVNVAIQRIDLKGSTKNKFYDKFYNVETGVSDLYSKESSLSGLGFAGRITENASVTAQSPVQGFDQTYTQVNYGILLSVTEKMWRFGIKKRNLERIVREATQAVEDKREQLCADRLDNAFSSSYTVNDISGNYAVTLTGGDGVALISNSHTREDGGTAWNNRITDGSTVNMDFDYDALKAAHRTAALITNPYGKPMNVSLDTLIVGRGYAPHNRAMEIKAAINRGYIPGSADRDGSAVGDFSIIASPWFQSNPTYWYMLDSSMKNSTYGLQYKEAKAIGLEGPNVVFKTGEIQYKATTWFDIGHNDARNTVGSKNTNAA